MQNRTSAPSPKHYVIRCKHCGFETHAPDVTAIGKVMYDHLHTNTDAVHVNLCKRLDVLKVDRDSALDRYREAQSKFDHAAMETFTVQESRLLVRQGDVVPKIN